MFFIENIIKPTSPHCVPHVASNIEVTDDSTVMERYMQRPQHALNMKRTINEQTDEDNNDMDTATTRREKMIKYTHGKNLVWKEVTSLIRPLP